MCLKWPRVREREEEEMTFEVICMEIWDKLHGYPKDNNEVAMASQLFHFLLGLGIGPRIWKGKGKIWAFAPKPNIRVNLGYVLSLKECGRIFIFLLD